MGKAALPGLRVIGDRIDAEIAAGARTLFQRQFDRTPTAEEARVYLADKSDDRRAKLIDRLDALLPISIERGEDGRVLIRPE